MRVVVADIRLPLARAAVAQATRLLPREEVWRAARLRRADDRLRSLTGQLVARHVLAEVLRCTWGEVRLFRDERGRPQVYGEADVSVSHAGPWVAVGVVAHGSIGIDVESVERAAEVPPRAFCAPSELAVLGSHHDHRRAAASLWALKEAYLKMRGDGFAVHPRAVTCEWLGQVSDRNMSELCGVACALLPMVEEDYVLALAIDEGLAAPIPEDWDWENFSAWRPELDAPGPKRAVAKPARSAEEAARKAPSVALGQGELSALAGT